MGHSSCGLNEFCGAFRYKCLKSNEHVSRSYFEGFLDNFESRTFLIDGYFAIFLSCTHELRYCNLCQLKGFSCVEIRVVVT